MGAHAFQDQVAGLAAATQSRSLAMPKRAEIVTLHRVSIVRPVTRLMDTIWSLRSLYIAALRELPIEYDAASATLIRSELEDTKAALERVIGTLSTPTLVDPEGDDFASLIEGIAADWARTSSDDGRYVRRLAKKLRAAGEACDIQRVKLHTVVSKMLEEVSVRLEIEALPELSTRTKYDALFEQSLSQYPVITAHLAK